MQSLFYTTLFNALIPFNYKNDFKREILVHDKKQNIDL